MLEQYSRINQAAGVGIHLNPDGTLSVHVVEITAKGDQLDIDKKVTDLSSLDELKKHLSAGSPIALNLSGKGILTKQIEKVEEISQANFSKILPNGKTEDFYIQNFVSGDQSFVSIIRKADADKWISQLEEQGFVPMMLSLGPFPAHHIITQLNSYEDEILFNGNIILRGQQSQWLSCRYEESAHTPFPLKIESESIHEKLVVPYSAAFQLVLASKLETVQAQVSYLDNVLQKKLDDNKFRFKGFIVLSVFFLLLLLNFIVLSWLNSSNKNLLSQVSKFARSTSNIQDINDKVKKKEGLLQNLGWDGGINKSSLVDQIAALMPGEITWQQVAINPIDINNSRIQKSLVFFSRRIRITGTSEKIIPVNEWMARIKTKAWVKDIQLDSYAYNNELNTGQFTILLNY